MATMMIRLPDEKHHRLRLLAQRNGVSLNKLVDDSNSHYGPGQPPPGEGTRPTPPQNPPLVGRCGP
jgi:hypothetical protein